MRNRAPRRRGGTGLDAARPRARGHGVRAAGAARLLPAERLALGEPACAPALAPDAPALLLFTSGSTGHPKGVLLSHRGLMNNARGVLAHSGLTPDDRLLHVMPLHHTNALNNQVFTPLLAGHAWRWPDASAPRTCRDCWRAGGPPS